MATDKNLAIGIAGIKIGISAIIISLMLPVIELSIKWAEEGSLLWSEIVVMFIFLFAGLYLLRVSFKMKFPSD